MFPHDFGQVYFSTQVADFPPRTYVRAIKLLWKPTKLRPIHYGNKNLEKLCTELERPSKHTAPTTHPAPYTCLDITAINAPNTH